MNGVQPLLEESILNFLDDLLSTGKVKINGVYKDYQLNRTMIEPNTIRKYIYIQDEEGLVEDAQLTTATGEVLAIKPVNVQKEDDGLIIAFEFVVNIQEG